MAWNYYTIIFEWQLAGKGTSNLNLNPITKANFWLNKIIITKGCFHCNSLFMIVISSGKTSSLPFLVLEKLIKLVGIYWQIIHAETIRMVYVIFSLVSVESRF